MATPGDDNPEVLPPDRNVSRLRDASTPKPALRAAPMVLRLTLAPSMTIDAWAFNLSALDTGARLGVAVIAPRVRYATVAWQDAAEPLDRRFVHPPDWRLLELAFQEHLPPTPLEQTHIVARVLVSEEDRARVVVQYASVLPLEVAPLRVAEQLDALLRSLSATRLEEQPDDAR